MHSVKRTISASAVVVWALAFGAGCGDDLDATSQAWCERADGCDLLSSSVDECATETLEWVDTRIPDGLRDDCDEALKDCNDRSSCQAYVSCSFNQNSLAFQCHAFVLDRGG